MEQTTQKQAAYVWQSREKPGLSYFQDPRLPVRGNFSGDADDENWGANQRTTTPSGRDSLVRQIQSEGYTVYHGMPPRQEQERDVTPE